MKAIPLILATVLLQQTGCDQPAQAPKSAAPDQTHYQRFIPVPPETGLTGVPWSGDVALDTMTGQLCKTHDLYIKSLESIPLCYHLYSTEHGSPDVDKYFIPAPAPAH
jgi:hypothetical protein